MEHFIELTQKIVDPFSGETHNRVISLNVEHIDFFYDKHIVLQNRAIDVYDCYDEIKDKIDKAQKGEG